MFLKFFILLLFLFILFIFFFLISTHKLPSYEYYTPSILYDGIYITNTVSTKVICIEVNSTNGLKISMKDTQKNPTYNANLKMNLNSGSDILDIQCANGNYWYFNYSSKYGVETNCSTIGGNNEENGEIIDLSLIPSSSIYENALLFENGSMITFDITGTHMIISTIPTNRLQSAQCIFALGTYDITNLGGNTIVFINNSINPPMNYFFYNGSCGNNSYGNNKNQININSKETMAIYVPSNLSQSIIPFSNGCFIDGSISSFPSGEQTLRFIGRSSVIQFNLNNTYDMFQIWNPSQSNYFYYNYSNQIGISETKYSIYSSGLSYWNMSSLNLLPYTPIIPFNDISYVYIDQILIYNPSSDNNLAILIQVDTNNYFNNIIMPDGANNYAITISSVLYKNGTMTSNPNATSRFFFNLNLFSSDIIDFNFGNNYITLNNKEQLSINKNLKQFSLIPNTSTLAIRNKPTNLLVFENAMNFKGGIQIGIDKNGNCLWKGSTTQIEFNIAELNNNYNFCMYGINSDGTMNYNINNLFLNNTAISNPIGNNISSGIIHHLTSWGNCGIPSNNYPSTNEITGNFMVGKNIDQPLSSTTPSSYPCSSVTSLNPISNQLFLTFSKGYTDSLNNSVAVGSVCMVEPNFSPSSIISNINSSNIINGNINIDLLSSITFSNNIQLSVNNNILSLNGSYGSFLTNLNQIRGNSIEITKNNSLNWNIPYSF